MIVNGQHSDQRWSINGLRRTHRSFLRSCGKSRIASRPRGDYRLVLRSSPANPGTDGLELTTREARSRFRHLAARAEIHAHELVHQIASTRIAGHDAQSRWAALARWDIHQVPVGRARAQIQRGLRHRAAVATSRCAVVREDRLDRRRERKAASRCADAATARAGLADSANDPTTTAVLGVGGCIDARAAAKGSTSGTLALPGFAREP
jgi:hypothetical protein